MAYYKVIHNKNIIDTVSGDLRYVKFQTKHRILLLCDESEAQGFLGDSENCYHTSSLLPFPVDTFATVTLEEITQAEYESLRRTNLMSADEIRMELLQELLERGVL